jgi:hypothetical protein
MSMKPLTQLLCPNCHFHVGDLVAADSPPKPHIDDVKEWLAITSWADYEPPAALYQRYSNWANAAGRDPLSQRRFSSRIIALGARFRSTTAGRDYAPPLP